MDRFDVIFEGSKVSIDYHFCRGVVLGEMNDTHGYSFREAKKIVVQHLEAELQVWRVMSFKEWRRANHPTEKEMYEDMDRAGSLYDLVDEYK